MAEKYKKITYFDDKFEQCVKADIGLMYPELHENTKIIGTKCFEHLLIKEITLPENCTIIEPEAFSNCFNLKNINFNNNLRFIENAAFMACTSLEKINLPNSIIEIKDSAFSFTAISELIIPDETLFLGNGAFHSCVNLKNIIIGKNINTIPDSCFCYAKIETLDLSNTNVFTIKNRAFKGCADLKTVILPKTIDNIAETAFEDCSKLEKIIAYKIPKNYPTSLKKITVNIFDELFNQGKSIKEINKILKQ